MGPWAPPTNAARCRPGPAGRNAGLSRREAARRTGTPSREPVGGEYQRGVYAMPGAQVGEEGGQPPQGIQRPLGQRAAEGDPVMAGFHLEGGRGRQDQMVVLGPRLAVEDLLVDFPYPLPERRRCRTDRGIGQAVQRDPGRYPLPWVAVAEPVERVQQGTCRPQARWRGELRVR